jgi:hypothetical protein
MGYCESVDVDRMFAYIGGVDDSKVVLSKA